VRFQKKLRLVSLEIPEPDATVHQNLVRPSPVLTRSGATKFCLSPIRHRINKKGRLLARARVTQQEPQIGAGKGVRWTSLLV
jgi:hypothetical protein